MNYPHVRAVLLDATFDHGILITIIDAHFLFCNTFCYYAVLPLATNVMPASLRSIVASTVKMYLNLDIAEQLIRYSGPVLLYRRTRDEIIALE